MPDSRRLPSRSAIRSHLGSPALQTDALQILKAVFAAVLAWVVAAQLLGLEQAFLAPWTALLTVHATVYRTVWRGAQTVLATVLGVVVASAVVQTLGISAWSLAVALLLGMGLARFALLRTEGMTVATTALFLITTGTGAQQTPLLIDRLLDTAIGVGIALVVNVTVIPPLNDRNAQQQVDHVDRKLGALLVDMAYQMSMPWESQDAEDWIERTRSIDGDVQHAWTLVRHATESSSWNPRRWRHPQHHEGYAQVLVRLEEGVSQTRSIGRYVRESSRQAQRWDPPFRDRYVDLLERTGHAIADPQAEVAPVREELRQLSDELSGEDLPGQLWPLYGALIESLRMIVDVVDDVATAQPVRT